MRRLRPGVRREHIGLLHYKESQDRLRPILDRIKDQHRKLVEAGRIEEEKPVNNKLKTRLDDSPPNSIIQY